MKARITEEQYNKVILTELGSRGMGLLSYIRKNYAVMGNSFTPRFGLGEKWYSKQDISKELKSRFNLSDVQAADIVDYYLDDTISESILPPSLLEIDYK